MIIETDNNNSNIDNYYNDNNKSKKLKSKVH